MHIQSTTVSLNVADVEASARFATEHFGFTQTMSADGFIALAHPEAGVHLTFLRTGLASFKPAEIAGPAGQGLLLAFVVDDVDTEFARLEASGARVVTPPETEPWGERYCQVADPNGIVWQLVHWVTAPDAV
ncbi:VOC family protein [Cellulomonas sp. Sa3CUA2]|uniref:VOC family protein n=1 Tax=Cellulomonas avistercoris TaxID=2762242 RepID=A0ABR8QHT9_9CELL|nr:VOC family protein [Cellulomonas avistercoris]MBD7919965.1 VOC family protein [Cellulomonas avistercoris]